MREDYIDILISHQNCYAQNDVKNLFSKDDYLNWFHNYNIKSSESYIKHAVSNLVQSNLTTGISVSCGTVEKVQYYNSGYTGSKKYPVSSKTLIDLASVTKILTCIAFFIINEQMGIKLNMSLDYYTKKFKNLRNINIIELMNFSKLFKTEKRIDKANDYEEALSLLHNITYININSPIYSDMGAMILGILFETIVQTPLSIFIKTEIFDKLHMNLSGFQCVDNCSEHCMDYSNEYRFKNQKLLKIENSIGLIHDPKVRILSEKCPFVGHAGIFSTAEDISILSQHLLRGDIISIESLNKIGSFEFQAPSTGSQRFGLLCYTKNPTKHLSEVPHQLSGNAFAISGYTGCSLLLDPLNKLFIFIGGNRLNNRISKTDLDINFFPDNALYYNGQKYIVSQNFVFEKDKLQEDLLLSLLCR